jgi:hypothetical protein
MLGQHSEIAWASPVRDSSYSGQILAALVRVTNRSFPPRVSRVRSALCAVDLPARLKSAAVVPMREREREREREGGGGAGHGEGIYNSGAIKRGDALKILRCTLQSVNDPCNGHNFP